MATFESTEWSLENDKAGGGVKPVTPGPGENIEPVGQVRSGELQAAFPQLALLTAYTSAIVAKTSDTSITTVSDDMAQQGAKIDSAMATQKNTINQDTQRNAA